MVDRCVLFSAINSFVLWLLWNKWEIRKFPHVSKWEKYNSETPGRFKGLNWDRIESHSYLDPIASILVRFPNSLGCELGERRSYSLWIELPGVFLPIFFIGRGKLGTELESSTQNLGSLISQTFKNLIGSAAERHFSLPPVCHFFGRPDIRRVGRPNPVLLEYQMWWAGGCTSSSLPPFLAVATAMGNRHVGRSGG